MSQPVLDTGNFLYIQGITASANSDADGSGGGSAQQVYNDEPTPDDPSLPALSFPTGGGTLTQWTGSAWV